MASPPVRPRSSSGLPPGVETGPLARRFAACLIDRLPVAVVSAIVFATGADGLGAVLGAVLVLAWAGLVWWMFATRAAGPGMRLMHLQLVGLSDGRPIGWGRFALRAVVLYALSVTGVGLLVMFVFLYLHRRHQGWHDLVANSVVIKERALAPRPGQLRAAKESAPPVHVAAATEDHADRPADVQVPAASMPVPADSSRSGPGRPFGAPAEAPPPPPPPPEIPWIAMLDDGREILLQHVLLLGRNPEPIPGQVDVELVKVVDEARTVSKSHLALGRDERGLFVRDLGSTNGSTVTDHSGVSRPCPPDEVVRVGEGTIVSFGDHWLEIKRGEASVGSAHAPVGS